MNTWLKSKQQPYWSKGQRYRYLLHYFLPLTSQKPRILLLSTVHPATDPRIVGKIAPTLSEKYEVICMLANFKNQLLIKKNESIILLPFFQRLIWRLLFVHPIVLFRFLVVRPQIVQIFVAELLPLAFVFRWFGVQIIYEVQENLYKKFPTKTYNRNSLFQKTFGYFDQKARQYFYFIFTEDSYLTEYHDLIKPHTVLHNFASNQWLSWPIPVLDKANPAFFYAGVISQERAFDTMLEAIQILKKDYPTIKLHLFGRYNLLNFGKAQNPAKVQDKSIVFYGYTDQITAFETSKNSFAGLALLRPVGDYSESYPSKIFDYMALGLPVITSDFELYRAVVEDNECGFCLSPNDSQKLAETMRWFIENPKKARVMGKNGRKAIQEKYNWEGNKLLTLYDVVLGRIEPDTNRKSKIYSCPLSKNQPILLHLFCSLMVIYRRLFQVFLGRLRV
jgi:glycosyltransferase involved in cell wall biosynthesis